MSQSRSSTGSPKDPPLTFKPLSEGLGFHPFSDGLPYAPVTPKRPSSPPTRPWVPTMGTGATAAGAPRFVVPPPPVARPVPLQPAPSAAPASRAAPAAAPAPAQEPAVGMAYLFKRVVAYVLDTSLNTGLCAGTLSLALSNQDLSWNVAAQPPVLVLSCLFLALFNWAIITSQEVAFGTSLGKRLFGLSLHGTASAVFLRAFFFLPSAGFAGIGLIWALFDRRRRCWHDLVVDLQPTEYASL